MKLPSILDGQLQLHPVTSAGPTQLSSAFHRRLATDARQRGEGDRAQAHEVLAELETGAVTAPQLWLGWWMGGLEGRWNSWDHRFFHVETDVQTIDTIANGREWMKIG